MDRPIERPNFGTGSDFVSWAYDQFSKGVENRGISGAARDFFFDLYRESGERAARTPRYLRRVCGEMETKLGSLGELAAMAATNHGSEIIKLEHMKRGYASMLLLFERSPYCPSQFGVDQVVDRITANTEKKVAA